jgi:hypothetical protein
MASAKVSILTRQELAKAAKDFRWNRRLPKWTVIVDGRELPARSLVLEAAGVPPNDSTNSHQAVAILQDRGFEVRYQGRAVYGEYNSRVLERISDEFIHSLRGRLKGDDSLVELASASIGSRKTGQRVEQHQRA